MLFDDVVQGKPRKLFGFANRNGFYYVLDRATGEFIAGTPYVKETWAKGLDAKGRPIPLPNSDPSPEGTLVYPSITGAINWTSNSYSPITKLFYVDAREMGSYFVKGTTTKWEMGKFPMGAGGERALSGDDAYGAIRALEATTGKMKWEFRLHSPSWVGTLATAGGLVFSGTDEGNFFALDAVTGKPLWEINLGSSLRSESRDVFSGRQAICIRHGRDHVFRLRVTIDLESRGRTRIRRRASNCHRKPNCFTKYSSNFKREAAHANEIREIHDFRRDGHADWRNDRRANQSRGIAEAQPPTAAAAAQCDRACLEGFVNQYLAALAARDPSKVPFASDVKFTENTAKLKVGEGTWVTFNGEGAFKLYFAEPEAGQVGFIGVMKEWDNPVIFCLRLKVADGKIAEVEDFVVRDANAAKRLDAMGQPNPLLVTEIPAGERATREELVKTANMYFSGLQNNDGKGVYPFTDDCNRIENASQTTNNSGAVQERSKHRQRDHESGMQGAVQDGILPDRHADSRPAVCDRRSGARARICVRIFRSRGHRQVDDADGWQDRAGDAAPPVHLGNGRAIQD